MSGTFTSNWSMFMIHIDVPFVRHRYKMHSDMYYLPLGPPKFPGIMMFFSNPKRYVLV